MDDKFLRKFGIEWGIVFVTGSGGKTTLIKRLAREAKARGQRVLVTATAKMYKPSWEGIDCVYDSISEGKITISLERLEQIKDDYDIVFVEADGSAEKPLKGWRDNEPVVGGFGDYTIGVVDASVIGRRAETNIIHRPELFYELTGLSEGQIIQKEHIEKIINFGLFKKFSGERIVYLSHGGADIKTEFKTICGDMMSCVILAAGRSQRMGADKLLLPLGETTVIEEFLKRFPKEFFDRINLTYHDQRIREIAERYGIDCIYVDAPEKGQGYSIMLGLESIESPVMFFTADQPLTSYETIKRLCEEHYEAPDSIIVPCCNGVRRNPVVFPAKAVKPLKNIEGDRGGKVVIDSGGFDVRSVDFEDCMQFTDIDDMNDYETVKNIWASKNL